MKIYGIIENDYGACYESTFYRTREAAEKALDEMVERSTYVWQGEVRYRLRKENFIVEELELED